MNCVEVADEYACVTDELNTLGADGWRLELGDRVFPDEAVIHLLYRPQ